MPVHQKPDIFTNIADQDYLKYQKQHDYQRVTDFLNFKQRDISLASGVSEKSVRFDVKIPSAIKERVNEWANLINIVAQHFDGDLEKTHTWFLMSNPLLGDISPREMIRVGRYPKLLKFILDSIQKNKTR
jgi:hypothetical protein